MHFDLLDAVPAAGLATAPLDVETETPGFVSAHFGSRQLAENSADIAENTGVRGRIRTWGAADGRLVHDDDLVQMLDALHLPVTAGLVPGPVYLMRQGFLQNILDQR